MKCTWDGHRWRIQKRKDGKVYSFSCSTPGAKGRKECVRKYEAWLFNEGTGEKSVKQVCDEYLEDLKMRRGELSGSYEQNERYIRLYIAPKCSTKKMCKMTLRDWQNVINGACGAKKDLSHKTLENLRGIIMSIIKFGYADYQCELPRGSLYVPQGHSRNEKEILQPDQIKRLFEKSNLWYWPLFVFLLLTGCRPGEGLGLRVEDIQGSQIRIERSINVKGIETSGKNENARRVIPLGDMAMGIIKQTIKRNEERKLHTPYIFCGKFGGVGNQSSMRRDWLQLKKERNLSGTVYSLRHTFISIMKGTTLSEQLIKDCVGHSVDFETFKTYGHIVDSDVKKTAQVIDLTFGRIKLGDNLGDNLSATGGQ